MELEEASDKVPYLWAFWVAANMWATSQENLSSGVRDQVRLKPAKLARVLKFWIYKLEVLYYPGSEQQRRWSDCSFVVHIWHKTGFLKMWLMSKKGH